MLLADGDLYSLRRQYETAWVNTRDVALKDRIKNEAIQTALTFCEEIRKQMICISVFKYFYGDMKLHNCLYKNVGGGNVYYIGDLGGVDSEEWTYEPLIVRRSRKFTYDSLTPKQRDSCLLWFIGLLLYSFLPFDDITANAYKMFHYKTKCTDEEYKSLTSEARVLLDRTYGVGYGVYLKEPWEGRGIYLKEPWIEITPKTSLTEIPEIVKKDKRYMTRLREWRANDSVKQTTFAQLAEQTCIMCSQPLESSKVQEMLQYKPGLEPTLTTEGTLTQYDSDLTPFKSAMCETCTQNDRWSEANSRKLADYEAINVSCADCNKSLRGDDKERALNYQGKKPTVDVQFKYSKQETYRCDTCETRTQNDLNERREKANRQKLAEYDAIDVICCDCGDVLNPRDKGKALHYRGEKPNVNVSFKYDKGTRYRCDVCNDRNTHEAGASYY
jgi:hypothetical protein